MTQSNLNFEQSNDQASMILSYLKAGHSITPLEALNRFACLRLGGRIYDLKKQGHKIESKMIKTPSGKRVAEYRLSQ